MSEQKPSDIVAEARARLSLWSERRFRGEDSRVLRGLIAEIEGPRAAVGASREQPFPRAPQGVIDAAIDQLAYVADQRYINDDDRKRLEHALGVLRNLDAASAAPPGER